MGAKCNELSITNQDLDREATKALVQAMNTRIERARICDHKMYRLQWENPAEGESWEWILDIEALTKYNGKGRCKNIILWGTGIGRDVKYRQWLRDWAQDRDWIVVNDDEWGIRVKRKTEDLNCQVLIYTLNFDFNVNTTAKEIGEDKTVPVANTRECEAYPRAAAVKTFHDKPQPIHKKRVNQKPNVIKQPRKC